MFRATLNLYRNAYSGLSPTLWWLALVMLINRAGTMVIPFLTVYLTQKGFSIAQAGYAMGAFGAGAIVGGFLGGWLTDKIGHLKVQVGSLFLNGLLFFLLGQMDSYTSILITIFFLSSIGESFRPANSAAIAAYSTDQNRTRGYSLNRLAINLGWAIGPAVGGLLASRDYTLLFYADGSTCIFAALVLFLIFRNKKEESIAKMPSHEPIGSAWKDGVFLKGMVALFFTVFCFFQIFSILPLYYKQELQMSEKLIGFLLALNGIFIVFFEMVLVYTLEKMKKTIFFITVGAFIIGVGFLFLNIAPLVSVVFLSMFFLTIGEMLLFPFMNDFWVSRTTPHNRGKYAALYTSTFSAAIMVAPALSSSVVSKWNFTTLWYLDFFICTLAAGGFYLLKQKTDESIQPRTADPVVGS